MCPSWKLPLECSWLDLSKAFHVFLPKDCQPIKNDVFPFQKLSLTTERFDPIYRKIISFGFGQNAPTAGFNQIIDSLKMALKLNAFISPKNHSSLSNATNTMSVSIGTAEIPIWIADKKKWVTGISKKTTVNDLIFAILKQCQLVSNATPASPTPTGTDHTAASSSSNARLLEEISQKYVLLEYTFEPVTSANVEQQQQQQIASQRILSNDSKVYKYLNKWSQLWSAQNNNGNNFMLKILQCQTSVGGHTEETTNATQMSASPLSSSNLNNSENSNNNNTTTDKPSTSTSSLATKILKKFGVSSNSNHQNHNSSNTSNSSLAHSIK